MTDIPVGYKQTEIGIIPNDWEVKKMLDITSLLNGLTYTPKNIVRNGLLVLRSSNIKNGKLDFNDNVFVNCDVDVNKYVKKGDIVICVRNGSAALLGKCAIAKRNYNATFGAFMAVLRGNDNEYLIQIWKEGKIQKNILRNSNATINQITNSDFNSILVQYPTEKSERLAIASTLSDMDELISNLDELIEKKKNIKKGAMQKLLSPKEGWIETILGKLCNITTGKLDANAAIKDGKYAFFTCAKETYKTNTYAFDGDALIINGNGDLGYTRMHSGKFDAYQRTYVLMNFSGDIKFIEYSVNKYLPDAISSEALGGAMPYIKLGTLANLKMYMPQTIEEQQAIASILSDMDKEIEALEEKKAKYEQIKQGAMQKLLTGKIRLV